MSSPPSRFTFTVIFNGVTMAPLMRALGLDQVPDSRKYSVNQAIKEVPQAGPNQTVPPGTFPTHSPLLCSSA